MRINISGTRPEHTINGLEIDLDEGVNGLRRAVAERINATPEQLRLIHMGRLIDDSSPLNSFLRDGATVHVVVTQASSRQQSEQTASNSGNNTTTNNNNNNASFSAADVFNFISDLNDGPTTTVSFVQGVAPNLFDSFRTLLPLIFNGEGGAAIRISAQGTSDSFRPSQTTSREQQQQQQQQQSQQQQQPQQQQQQQQRSQQQRQQQQQRTQQQQIQQSIRHFSFSPVVPSPEIVSATPLHIHVHVTPNELEDLPDRLQRFLRRTHSSGINLRTHIEHGLVPQDSSSFARATAVATNNDSNNNNNNNNNATTGNENIIGSALSFTVLTTDDDSNEDGGFGNIFSVIFNTIEPSNLLQIIQNDYSFAASSRPSLVQLFTHCLESTEGPVLLTQEEKIQQFSQRIANTSVNGIMQRPDLVQFIEQQVRPNFDFYAHLRKYIAFMHEEFVVGVLNRNLSDDEWGRNLRIFVSRAVGIFMEHFSALFIQGNTGLLRFVTLIAKYALHNIRSLNSTFLEQNFWLVGSTIPSLVSSLHTTYLSSYRRESDSDIFATLNASEEEEELQQQQQRQQQQQQGENVNQEVQEEDDLLDDCLDEFCGEAEVVLTNATNQRCINTKNSNNNKNNNNESGASDISLLNTYIRGFRGLSDESRDGIQRRAQRFRREEPCNNDNDDDNNNTNGNSSSKMWKYLTENK